MRSPVRNPLALLLAAVLAVLAPGVPAAQEAVRITGSTTVYVNLFQEHRQEISAASGVQLEFFPNSSRLGLLDLLAARSDVAMVSAPLPELWAKLSDAERVHHSLQSLKSHHLGESRIVFIVHPSNPIRSLTLAQVGKLLEGKITNWKEVGGADLPVVVVSNVLGTGTRTFIEEELLQGRSMTDDVRAVINSPQIIQVVKQLPGAIGHSSAKLQKLHRTVTAAVKTERDIVQPLFLITTSSPPERVAKVTAAAVEIAGK